MLSKPTNASSNQPSSIEQYKTKPTLMIGLLNIRIVRISCGDSFSMALTDNGQVYSWGDDTFGQLGTVNSYNRTSNNGSGNRFFNVPCKITALENIIIGDKLFPKHILNKKY